MASTKKAVRVTIAGFDPGMTIFWSGDKEIQWNFSILGRIGQIFGVNVCVDWHQLRNCPSGARRPMLQLSAAAGFQSSTFEYPICEFAWLLR
jgi:hypothetical protein